MERKKKCRELQEKLRADRESRVVAGEKMATILNVIIWNRISRAKCQIFGENNSQLV